MKYTKDSRLEQYVGNTDDLIGFLKYKGDNHKQFKYYAGVKTIKAICNSQSILLSDGKNWNDLVDGMDFHEGMPGYRRFGACFSFSVSESVAMWMLYGGIRGEGAMIELSRSDLNSIIKTGTVELGYRTNDHGFSQVEILESGYNLYRQDILYVGEDDNGITVKRSDERVEGLNNMGSSPSLLKKAYPWAYENEVRLILEIPEEYVPKNAECARVKLPFTESELSSRCYIAPNSTGVGSGFNRSRLKGEIRWNLCSSCENK